MAQTFRACRSTDPDGMTELPKLPTLRPPETWRELEALWQRTPRSELETSVGRWALGILEHALGPSWLQTCWRTGALPPELASTPGSLHAFAMLLDLAVALDALRDRSGMAKVRRILRTNPTSQELASARCALRLAAAAASIGTPCELEVGKPPIDVVLDGSGPSALALEIKSVFRADLTLEVDAWLFELKPLILEIFHDRRLSLQGEAREALDPTATERLAAQIIDAAGLVRLGLEAPIIVAGANRFRVVPATDQERPGSNIRMPSIDLWRRIASRISGATEQAASSGATWVVIDSQDDLWTLTLWSQGSIGDQATGVAEAIVQLAAPEPAVDGVVITDCGRLADLDSVAETVKPGPRVLGIRRRLDYVRVRQAVIVALTARGEAQLDSWLRLFDAEPNWVAEALMRRGLEYPPSLRGVNVFEQPV